MKVDRRTFLVEGSRLVAALAGPALPLLVGCRAPGGRAGPAPGGSTATLAPLRSARANLCGAPSASSSALVRAAAPLHPEKLARYVDALPIPSVLEPAELRPDPQKPDREIPYYRVAMKETRVSLHRDLPPTRVWTYGGSMPGPTIDTRSGQSLLVEWVNELPERHFLPIDYSLHGAHAGVPDARAVVHVHGAKAPPESDGYPEHWLPPGQSAVYRYPNQQESALLWYHDHTMGIERLNLYAGLFGAFVVRDDVEDALALPKGAYEVPLLLCDRLLDREGQLRYPTSGVPESPWVSELYGDVTLVNGKITPYLDVEPRLYRFRVVNASNSRLYYLALSNGETIRQIGTDQGLLPAPVAIDSVTVAPGERSDLVVDFSKHAGQSIQLKSQSFELMQFRVASGGQTARAPSLPSKLRTVPKIPESAAAKTRVLTLNEYEDPKTHRMQMLLNGAYWRDPVTENPALGSVEIWNLMNLTEDTHPIHLHLVRFQILDRRQFDADEYLTNKTLHLLGKPVPPRPEEAGWKDTVRAEPGLITRIIAKFDGYAGRYVWHCHLLEHAANEMMRPFDVLPNA